jgi:hypothetical protein
MNDLIERLRSVKWEVIDEGDRMPVPDDPTHKCVFVDMRPDDFRALLREAAAAIEAAREDGWQPIETAPKDGTTVIGFWCGSRGTVGVVNGTNYGITAFNPDSGEWYDASEAGNEDDEWARPDFWRPLPAPPAIDRARGKAGQEVGK